MSSATQLSATGAESDNARRRVPARPRSKWGTPETMCGERNHGAGCLVFRPRYCMCFRPAGRVRPFGGHARTTLAGRPFRSARYRIPPAIASRPPSHPDHLHGVRRHRTLPGRGPARPGSDPYNCSACRKAERNAASRRECQGMAYPTPPRAVSRGAAKTETTPDLSHDRSPRSAPVRTRARPRVPSPSGRSCPAPHRSPCSASPRAPRRSRLGSQIHQVDPILKVNSVNRPASRRRFSRVHATDMSLAGRLHTTNRRQNQRTHPQGRSGSDRVRRPARPCPVDNFCGFSRVARNPFLGPAVNRSRHRRLPAVHPRQDPLGGEGQVDRVNDEWSIWRAGSRDCARRGCNTRAVLP